MTTQSRKRLITDYKKFLRDGAGLGILVQACPTNMMIWEAIIFGPDDTDWEGGVFKLMMEFTDKFPGEPPKVKFLSRMYHPNIYTNGEICLNILGKDWSPTMDA